MMKTVVWKPVEYEGIEHLELDVGQSGVVADGIVIGLDNTSPFRLQYLMTCDQNYHVQTVRLVAGNPRRSIFLSRYEDGNWMLMHETGLPHHVYPELKGCIDVDISATPFTNTLPIRRLQWQPGQSETFRMVYITVPKLTVSVDPQRYTCLEKNEQGGVFRFESLDSGFTADITVDADGLVVHYPGLFERVV